ncbi:MAG: outer membrane protein assembly factor BamE [Alphaproteobacteria bacterium]
MLKNNILIFVILLSISITISSCVSKKIVNGNLPDADMISILKIGKDDKNSVVGLLGEPSFRGSLGDNSYYYVGTLSSQIAFLRPSVKEQYILELRFNKKSLLKNIYFYDKSSSTSVAMSSLETESGGAKQTILQQLLGNFGVPGMKRGGPILGSGKAED